MPEFTIETTFRLLAYRRRTYQADTAEQACEAALEDDDWSGRKEDYEVHGPAHVRSQRTVPSRL